MPEGNAIYIVIALSFFGFVALAFVLLYPVYRFMKRQERMADDWTTDAVARRQREIREARGDGSATRPPDEPAQR